MSQGVKGTFREWLPGERESLLEFIASGKPLRQWLRDNPTGPSRKTVNEIVNANHEGFGDQYREARLIGADEIAQDALDIIDAEPGRTTLGGYDSAHVAWAKNRAFFRMEALKKWFPQKYGDKVTQELTGANGGPVQIEGVTVKLVRPDAG